MAALTAVARGQQVGFAPDAFALGFTALLTRLHVNWKDEGERESRLHAESFFFAFSCGCSPATFVLQLHAGQRGELKVGGDSLCLLAETPLFIVRR